MTRRKRKLVSNDILRLETRRKRYEINSRVSGVTPKAIKVICDDYIFYNQTLLTRTLIYFEIMTHKHVP